MSPRVTSVTRGISRYQSTYLVSEICSKGKQKVGRIVNIFRIINGIDKVTSNKIFQLADDRVTTDYSSKIYKYKTRANIRVKKIPLVSRHLIPELIIEETEIYRQ